MKNITKTLGIIMLLFWIIPTGFSKQKTYYYSNNKKVELDLDTNIIVLKSKTITSNEFIKQQFKNVNFIEEDKNKVSKFNAVKELSHSKNSIISTLLKNKDTYCWYELKDGNNIIIPTGEIIFKPKTGIDYKSILSKLNLENKLQLKSINEYNYIIVSSKDINSIFDIANKIYESGLVEFSHPNFWIPIELNTNDALYNQQFYLRNTGQTGGVNGIDINVEPAWCLTTGNNIRVAVIDDGVEAHEDIAGRVVNGFTPRNNTGLGAPNISGRHGQACAGIIGATPTERRLCLRSNK